MLFYDDHLHKKNKEAGGFLVGLEGEPQYEGTLNNREVVELQTAEKKYISFYYLQKKEIHKVISHKYIKYHPKREMYSPEEVIESISINQPKAVIIDTLNEPYWKSYDYWKIAREFNDIIFIFAHAGGYLINDFIKICNFQKNVYIDFSLTQCVLGKYGDEKGLAYVNNAILFALNSNFRNRILMGSDYPFYNQEDVLKYYEDYIQLLNTNFECLFDLIH